MRQLHFRSGRLLPSAVSFLIWLSLFLAVCLIEQSLGLPFVSLTIMVIAVRKRSSVWAFCFMAVATLILTAVLSTNILFIWLVMSALSLSFRSFLIQSTSQFLPRFCLVLTAGLLIAILKVPNLTTPFIFHSGVSLIISSYLIWRMVRKNGQTSAGVGLRLQ